MYMYIILYMYSVHVHVHYPVHVHVHVHYPVHVQCTCTCTLSCTCTCTCTLSCTCTCTLYMYMYIVHVHVHCTCTCTLYVFLVLKAGHQVVLFILCLHVCTVRVQCIESGFPFFSSSTCRVLPRYIKRQRCAILSNARAISSPTALCVKSPALRYRASGPRPLAVSTRVRVRPALVRIT